MNYLSRPGVTTARNPTMGYINEKGEWVTITPNINQIRWKCEYCGRTHKMDIEKCGGCGASRRDP